MKYEWILILYLKNLDRIYRIIWIFYIPGFRPPVHRVYGPEGRNREYSIRFAEGVIAAIMELFILADGQ